MKRMVLIAFMVFCNLLLLGQEKACAIPSTFTWDVSGFLNGQDLGSLDSGNWSTSFFIEPTDHSWFDSWGGGDSVQNSPGDVVRNIDFVNTVTYGLDVGQTYRVGWVLSAHAAAYQGNLEWEIEAQMDRTGSFPWLSQENHVSGTIAADTFTLDTYSQFDPVLAAGSVSSGSMAVESMAATDLLDVNGSVSLNPNAHSALGYVQAEFTGTFEVVPDVVPAPGGLMLGAFGIGIVGWLRGRRTL